MMDFLLGRNTKDFSKKRTSESIDVFDSPTRPEASNEWEKMSTEELLLNLEQLKGIGASSRQEFLAGANSIREMYHDGITQMGLKKVAEDCGMSTSDQILAGASVNKVRELSKNLINMLLREKPSFSPDPSGSVKEINGNDVVIAQRFLEYVWDRGGLRRAILTPLKDGVRYNRGILKTHWSQSKKDFVFEPVNIWGFYFDASRDPEDSWYYIEEREVPFYKIKNSGVYNKSVIETIKKEIGINSAIDGVKLENTVSVIVTDYYIKTVDDSGNDAWMIYSVIGKKVLLRRTEIAPEDIPFSFFIPERETFNNNAGHSMLNVAQNASTANQLHFKLAQSINYLTDAQLVIEENQRVTSSHTGGLRTFSISSVDGGVNTNPVHIPRGSIPQEVFEYLNRIDQNANANLAVHPDLMASNAPSNGIVAQSVLQSDVHAASATAQEFQLFLSSVAYKILHIAYHRYTEHKTIHIELSADNVSSEKVVGGAAVEGAEDIASEAGVGVIKKFPNIAVRVVPSSAYTEANKINAIMGLAQVFGPEITKVLPRAEILNAFGFGSAKQLMMSAAKEISRQEEQEMNPEVAIAEAENKVLESGKPRAPQPQDDHMVHDQVHVMGETFATEQMRATQGTPDAERWAQVVSMYREHRQQHQEMLAQMQTNEAQSLAPSPQVLGSDQQMKQAQQVDEEPIF